jgi:hypothetical protein
MTETKEIQPPWRDRILVPVTLAITAVALLAAAILSYTSASIYLCLTVLGLAGAVALGGGALHRLLRYLER